MTDQFCCFFQIGLIDESSRCGSPSAAAAASASCCLNLGGCFWYYEWNRCPGAAWMVLWPFRLIADKLVKMIGGRAPRHNAGGDEEEVEAKEGRLFSFRFDRPVSCRSRFVDVGLLPLLSQFSSVSAADCPAWSMMVVSCGFLGPSCAAAIRLGLRPRLRVDGLEDHRVGAVRHPRPREALSHHKVSPLSSYSCWIDCAAPFAHKLDGVGCESIEPWSTRGVDSWKGKKNLENCCQKDQICSNRDSRRV